MGTRWPETCWATYKEQLIRRNKYNSKWHLVGFLFHIELRCTVNHTSNSFPCSEQPTHPTQSSYSRSFQALKFLQVFRTKLCTCFLLSRFCKTSPALRVIVTRKVIITQERTVMSLGWHPKKRSRTYTFQLFHAAQAINTAQFSCFPWITSYLGTHILPTHRSLLNKWMQMGTLIL